MPVTPRSGIRLNADRSVLEFKAPDNQQSWSLPVSDIVLVAEYTTNEGPFLDDYFLVFVTDGERKLNFATASFYSEGRDEVVQQLSHLLNANIELQLFHVTEWKSRVVWPPELMGRE